MYCITFDTTKQKPEQILATKDLLNKEFPNEKFILLPDGYSCMRMTKQELKQVIDRLTEYYEVLKDE